MSEIKFNYEVSGSTFDCVKYALAAEPIIGGRHKVDCVSKAFHRALGFEDHYSRWAASAVRVPVSQEEYENIFLGAGCFWEATTQRFLEDVIEKLPDPSHFGEPPIFKYLNIAYVYTTDDHALGGYFLAPKIMHQIARLGVHLELIIRT